MQRIQRIQLQADISVMDFNREGENFNFPRTRHLNASYEVQDKELGLLSARVDRNCAPPSHLEIINILTSAKRDAYSMISSLGMKVDIAKADDIQIRNLKVIIYSINVKSKREHIFMSLCRKWLINKNSLRRY